MMIGLLGILKASATYLPIDPEFPDERIEYMLEDSGAKILLCQQDLINKCDFKGEIINILDEKIYYGDISNLKNSSKSNDLAYVVYTSGSTGKPKGVMITHSNLYHFVKFVTTNS